MDLFVRIRPHRDAPGRYHAVGVQFEAGRWYCLPEKFEWEGHVIDTRGRLGKVTNDAGAFVFDVCTKQEAQDVSEAARLAELERMMAEQKAVSGVAPVETAVTPAVKAVAETNESPAQTEPQKTGARGRGARVENAG